MCLDAYAKTGDRDNVGGIKIKVMKNSRLFDFFEIFGTERGMEGRKEGHLGYLE